MCPIVSRMATENTMLHLSATREKFGVITAPQSLQFIDERNACSIYDTRERRGHCDRDLSNVC